MKGKLLNPKRNCVSEPQTETTSWQPLAPKSEQAEKQFEIQQDEHTTEKPETLTQLVLNTEHVCNPAMSHHHRWVGLVATAGKSGSR